MKKQFEEERSYNGLNKNASSMQRRMNTPVVLTYRWYHLSITFIMFGLFMIVNWVIWFLLTSSETYRGDFYGIISTLKPENVYDPTSVKFIYYIDGDTVNYFLKPAITALIVGLIMVLVKKLFYRQYVNKEVKKMSEQFAGERK